MKFEKMVNYLYIILNFVYNIPTKQVKYHFFLINLGYYFQSLKLI